MSGNNSMPSDPYPILPVADDLDQNDEDIGALGSILSWEDAQDYPSSDRLSNASNLASSENNSGQTLFYNSVPNPFMNNSSHLNTLNANNNINIIGNSNSNSSNGGMNSGMANGMQDLSSGNNSGVTPFGLPTHLLANFLVGQNGNTIHPQFSQAQQMNAGNNSTSMNSLPLILPAALNASLPWNSNNSNINSKNNNLMNNKDNGRGKSRNIGDVNMNSNRGSTYNGENADFTDTDTSQTTSSYHQRLTKKPNLATGSTSSNNLLGKYQQTGKGVNSHMLTPTNLQQIQTQSQSLSNINSNGTSSSDQGAKQSNAGIVPSSSLVSIAEDKQQANRDRNREHARNTRLRKKAYLEKLKVTVDELCRERDSLLQERTANANRVLETLATRTEVILGFLALRQHPAKHLNHSLWNSLISEHSFQFLLPVTPYRSFPAAEVSMQCCRRTLHGIEALIADCASLHMMFNSLLALPTESNSKSDQKYYGEDQSNRVSFQYSIITENTSKAATTHSVPSDGEFLPNSVQSSQVQMQNPSNLVSGIVCNNNQMMARWQMKTTNLMKFGASSEVSKGGMLYCKFNSNHQITHIEILFDVMAFMLQLKNAASSILASWRQNQCPGNFYSMTAIIPNTLHTANIANFDGPMCITSSERPWIIVDVNQAWENMTGFLALSVINKQSPKILQGKSNDSVTNSSIGNLADLSSAIIYKRVGEARVINFDSKQRPFEHVFRVFPLSSDSRISHYLGVTVYWKYLSKS